MTQARPRGMVSGLALLLTGLPLLSRVVYAEDLKIEGVIKGRSGNTLVLQTSDSPTIIVLLTDSTDVGQLQGALRARNKMSMAALIPGLPIRVKGSYDAQNQLVANTIRFKGNDLEQAQAIEGRGA